MFLRWQLVDVITVFSTESVALASTITGENPALIIGPYGYQDLPMSPRRAKIMRDPANRPKLLSAANT
jgi:hypothetical protein